jgi:osmotically-inducible protein OsmY
MHAGESKWKGSNQRSRGLLLAIVSSTLFLFSTLGGCANFKKCGLAGCAADNAITADVTAQFARYPSLTANSVRIQTLDQVVYLTGLVDTDVERLLAVSVAGDVPGVARVVDSISVNNVSR